MSSALDDVRAELAAEGGLIAAALASGAAPADPHGLGARVAQGPRARGRERELALVIEAIHEGGLLHEGRSRLLDTDDRDLELLAGDRLYALGLERLAALGDLDAVAELATVIALCAQARAEDRPALAAAAWAAGVAAIGWGSSDALRSAQAAARAGEPGAERALDAAARQVAP